MRQSLVTQTPPSPPPPRLWCYQSSTSHQPDRSRPSHRPMPTLTGTANDSMVVAAAAAMWQRRRSEDTVAEMRSNRQAVVATLIHQLTIGGISGHSGWLALSYFLLDKARKICKVFRKSSGSHQEVFLNFYPNRCKIWPPLPLKVTIVLHLLVVVRGPALKISIF